MSSRNVSQHVTGSYSHLTHQQTHVSLEQPPSGCCADEPLSSASAAAATEWDLLLPGNVSVEADSPGYVFGVKCPAVTSSAETMDTRTSPGASRPASVDTVGSSEEIACRICQDGDLHEKLISPCLCSGTVGFVHISCLNTWLHVTSRTSCELCDFPFPVTKKLAPVSEYLRHPKANMDLPNLVCDLACLVVLTPLLFASVYLSSTGSVRYESLGQTGSMCAVATLLIALLLVYVSWAALAIVYHVRVWRAWRERHSTVTLLDESQMNNFQLNAAKRRIPRPPDRKLATGRKLKVGLGLCEDRDGQSHRTRRPDIEMLLAPINRLAGWISVNNRVAVRSTQPA